MTWRLHESPQAAGVEGTEEIRESWLDWTMEEVTVEPVD